MNWWLSQAMYVVPKGRHETFDTIGQNSDEKKWRYNYSLLEKPK